MRFPNTTHDLVEQLDKMFPEPAIGPNDTMDKIKFEAGQRSVIVALKRWRDSANADPAEPRERGSGRPVARP